MGWHWVRSGACWAAHLPAAAAQQPVPPPPFPPAAAAPPPPAQCRQTGEPESKEIRPHWTSADSCSAMRSGLTLSAPIRRDNVLCCPTSTINAPPAVLETLFVCHLIENKGGDPRDYVLLTGTHGLSREQVQNMDTVRLRTDLFTDMQKSCI